MLKSRKGVRGALAVRAVHLALVLAEQFHEALRQRLHEIVRGAPGLGEADTCQFPQAVRR
jgi:hypothetical protein